ncbi:MAG: LL-diaminopimelate aminotransferase [Firmicutes bacterium]|nr:LL-diaminopimelate aminotransferase [Bacillota bacterium]
MTRFARAERLQKIPPYLFAELDRRIAAKRAAGVDVISLGVGDPDRPTPPHIVERLAREAARPEWHRYPSYVGAPEFRRAAARWLERNYGVQVDPDREVVALIGSKEGLAHLCWALVNPGDAVLVPDPGYPVYRTQAVFAGGEPVELPLRAERGFLPDLAAVPETVARRARLLFLNYPNNPTGATATAADFAEWVAFARRHGIAFAHDAAYVDLALDGGRAPIALQAPGAKDVTIEFFSLSKPYNMTGWRLGFAAGNAELVQALATVKENTDSGQFTALQMAGVEALENTPEAFLEEMRALYRRRLEKAAAALREAGFDARRPRATFYLWVPVPAGYTAEQVAERMLEEAGVVVSPGTAYGRHGAGYIRLSLTLPDERLDEALDRIRRLKF